MLKRFCLLILCILHLSTAEADNPGILFGVELGQDVFELPEIDKFGSAGMQFRFTPNEAETPFDLYSVYADNDYSVQAIYAMAPVSATECQKELKDLAHRIAANHGIRLIETLKKNKTVFVSEDENSLILISCNRYRKYRQEELKDITLVLAAKDRTTKLSKPDAEKRARMHEIISTKKRQRREIKLESSHDFSGVWASDCTKKDSGIGITKIRENYYHFLLCGSFKCINLPRISSDDVKIIDTTHLKIAGLQYKRCAVWDEKKGE